MTKTIIGAIISGVAIESLPTTSSSANLKAGHAEGLSNIGKTFPTIGKVKGAELTLKSTKSLKDSSKELLGGASL